MNLLGLGELAVGHGGHRAERREERGPDGGAPPLDDLHHITGGHEKKVFLTPLAPGPGPGPGPGPEAPPSHLCLGCNVPDLIFSSSSRRRTSSSWMRGLGAGLGGMVGS